MRTGLVQSASQFPVGGLCGLQLVRPFIELALNVGEVLLQRRDASLKLVDVGWRPRPDSVQAAFQAGRRNGAGVRQECSPVTGDVLILGDNVIEPARSAEAN